MAVNFYDSEETKFRDLKDEISRGLRTLLLDKVQRITDADSNKILLSTSGGGIKESDKGPDDFAPAFAGSAADRILLSTGDGGIKESDRTTTEFLTRFSSNTPGKILTTDITGRIVESKARVAMVDDHVGFWELPSGETKAVNSSDGDVVLAGRRALRDIRIKNLYARVLLSKRPFQRGFLKVISNGGQNVAGIPLTLSDSPLSPYSEAAIDEKINALVAADDRYEFAISVSDDTRIEAVAIEWLWEYR